MRRCHAMSSKISYHYHDSELATWDPGDRQIPGGCSFILSVGDDQVGRLDKEREQEAKAEAQELEWAVRSTLHIRHYIIRKLRVYRIT